MNDGIKKPCCETRTCQRQQTIRLMRDAVTKEWLVLTQYSEGNDGVIEVFQKHILDPRDAEVLDRLSAKPAPRTVVTADLPVVDPAV